MIDTAALENKKCERCGKAVGRRYASARRFCGRNCAAAYRADKRRKPRGVCALCGKPRPRHNLNGCSAKCAYTLRKLKTRSPRTCPVCKREYFHKGKLRLKFCSKRCCVAAQSAKAWVTFECPNCGLTVQRRVRRKKADMRFCNLACRTAFWVGPRHPSYRGTADPNRGPGWLRLAATIRKRDGYVCRRCGRTQVENGGSLDVDHIKPWRAFENKAEANDPSNLASLCKPCHRHKTGSIERKWLRGDVLAMQQYERAIKRPLT